MTWLRGALLVAYPLLVFAGLELIGPRGTAVAAALALGLRAVWPRRGAARAPLRRLLAPAAIAAAVLLATLLLDDPRALLLVPGLVNAGLLFVFGRTLFGGETLVESIARLQHPDLSQERVRHCRSVTIVWCLFFLGNGGVSLWLALHGDAQLWALYTGGIAYVLMGLLFAGEFAVRSWRFPRDPAT
jgi:uncharacterized membrane protein